MSAVLDRPIDKMLAAALDYAAKGKAVLPTTIDKNPYNKHGVNGATRDPRQIRAWWELNPGANIGVACGPINGLFVVDCDAPPVGEQNFLAICAEHDHDPSKTLIQDSPSGGAHYIYEPEAGDDLINYTHRPDGKDPISMCDTRSRSGYILVEPSTTAKGAYKWRNHNKPLPLPRWLADLYRRKGPELSARPLDLPAPCKETTPYGRAVLEGEARTVASTLSGGRNTQLNNSSLRVHRLVSGGEIAEADAQAVLEEAAAACGLGASEALKTINSGKKAGMANPIVKPENKLATPPPCEEQPETPVLKVTPRGLEEFLEMEIKPRKHVFYPILPEKGIAMVFAYRGIGKTHFALNVAYATACGAPLFNIDGGPKWFSPTARKVLYVDGEMPAAEMQDRLRAIKQGAGHSPERGYFNLLCYDEALPLDMPAPNLTTDAGQRWLDPHLEGIDLLVLDNIATLFPRQSENGVESWIPIQKWLLRLRRRGLTILLVHHAGKNGEQRDTSAKEDILDTSIRLRRPEDYMGEEDGARFIVELTKARGITGIDSAPFEAQLNTDEGKTTWLAKRVEDDNMGAVLEMAREGKSERAIAKELGITASKVHRLKVKAQKTGQL